MSKAALLALGTSIVLGCFSATAAAATYVVTTTADSGPGSLRQAILDDDAGGVAGAILFDIGSNGAPQTIQLASPLPSITQSGTQVNGYSQVPGILTPAIEIDGSLLPQDSTGITVVADGVQLLGLAIGGFPAQNGAIGIYANDVSDLEIAGCYLGTHLDGVTVNRIGSFLGDGSIAIRLDTAVAPQILDDVVVGATVGIWLSGGSDGLIEGSLIGIGWDQRTPIANDIAVRDVSSGLTMDFDRIANDNVGISLEEGSVGATIDRNIFGIDYFGGPAADVTAIQALGAANDARITANQIVNSFIAIAAPSSGVTILSNSIYDVGYAAILRTLFGSKVGAPFSLSPSPDGTAMRISGSAPIQNADYRIQLFADDVAGPDGFGTGTHLLYDEVAHVDFSSTLSLDVPIAGAITRGQLLTLTATGPDGSTSELSRQTMVPFADISVLQSLSTGDHVLSGTSETWTVVVDNAGPSDAPVTLHDVLSPNVNLTSATVSQGTKSVVVGAAGTTIDATLGVIPSGANATLVLVVAIPATANGTVSNVATAASADDVVAGNDGSISSITVDRAPIAFAGTTVTREDVPVAIDTLATDADGDALQYALAGSPAHGQLSGTLPDVVYTPNSHYVGLDAFSFTATDGQGTTSATTETIVVQAVNHAPVAAADSYSGEEDTPFVVAAGSGVLANDTDLDGNVIRALETAAPAHGALALSTNGGFVYTPAANYDGADSFSYVAWDGTSISAPAIVSLTVGAVADLPPAPVPSSPTPGAALLAGNVTFAWQPVVDPDGSSSVSYHVTLSRVGHPDVTIDGTQPTATAKLAAGSWTWKVSATTPSGTSPDSAAVSFLVKGTKSGSGGCEVAGDGRAGLLGAALALFALLALGHRRRAAAAKRVAWVASVFVALSATSRSARATDFVVTTTADSGPGSLRQAILDSDATGQFGDRILFAIGTNGAPQTIFPTSPLPPMSASGIRLFGNTQSGGFAPSIEIDGSLVPGSAALTITGNGIDVQAVAIGGGFQYGVFSPGPTLDVEVAECYFGTHLDSHTPNPIGDVSSGDPENGVDIRLDDATDPVLIGDVLADTPTGLELNGGSGGVGEQLFVGEGGFFRNPLPDLVGIYDDSTGFQLLFNIIAYDVDAGLVLGPASSGIDVHDSIFGLDYFNPYGVPAPNLGGNIVVQPGASGARFFQDTIAGGPAGLLGVGPGISVLDNSMFGFQDGSIAASDGTVQVAPFALSVSGTSAVTVSGTATPDTDYRVELFADSVAGAGGLGTGQRFLGVDEIVHTDGSGNGSLSVPIAGAVARGMLLTLSATAPDGTTLGFSPDLLVPAADLSVTQSLSTGATVLSGTTETWTVTVHNAGPSDADVSLHDLLDANAALISATPSQGSANMAFQSDGIAIDVAFGTIVSGSSATLSIASAIPAATRGTVSNSATVSSLLDVVAANDSASASVLAVEAPVAFAQTSVTDEDQPVAIDTLATDPQGDPLQYTLVTAPAHGTLSGTLPAVTYTPASHYVGLDAFSFTASNGTGTTSATTETVVVQGVDHPPIAVADTFTTDEDVALVVPPASGVLANDVDVDGRPLRAVLTSPAAHGSAALSTSGGFTYTPSPNYDGADSFSYVAWDGTSISTPAIVSLTVGPVADLPPAPVPAAPSSGEVLVTGNVTFTWLPVTDVDGGSSVSYHLTASRAGQPDVTIDASQPTATAKLASGSWTWKVSATTASGTSPDSAPVSFEVKGTGGGGGCGCDVSQRKHGLLSALGLSLLALALVSRRRARVVLAS